MVRKVSKLKYEWMPSTKLGLNPFEVREVSKQKSAVSSHIPVCLNPFEVREVSKRLRAIWQAWKNVLIPLKSGKFLNGNYR